MVDLGQYAASVLGAYAVSVVLLVGITALSLIRSAKTIRQLRELEARREAPAAKDA